LKFSDKKTKKNSKPKKLNKKLKQSATQLWLLGVNLPLMVGVNISEDDIAWTCFTTLLNVCRLDLLRQYLVFNWRNWRLLLMNTSLVIRIALI
jgi:hypothetical protein